MDIHLLITINKHGFGFANVYFKVVLITETSKTVQK